MTVAALGSIQGVGGGLPSLKGVPPAAPSGKSFQDALLQNKQGLPALMWPNSDLHRQMAQLQHKVEAGYNFAPRELLLYQIKASQLHLQVELVSKAAESLLATARKFQNPS